MLQLIQRIRSGALCGIFLALTLVIALGCVYVACSNSLHRTCFVTGWLLYAALAAAFTRRFLRLRAGTNPERWVGQQTAIAVAIVMLFLMHVEFTRPNGWFDGVLTGLFLVVVTTGSIGAVLWTQLRTGSIVATCDTPDADHARAHIELSRRAEAAITHLGAGRSVDLLDTIRESFNRRSRLWRRVLWNNDLARTLGMLDSLKKDAENADAEALDTLSSLAIEKDRLDAIRAGDSAVRRWLLVHMPCVACLLALGALHGVIAHAHGVLAHVLLGK